MSTTQKLTTIHPFAGRMASEIAFKALDGLKKEALILDPMSGSGTVLRTISELGYNGIGFDIDPLSVLMTKAWTSKIPQEGFLPKVYNILNGAEKKSGKNVYLPWIDEDAKTKQFIDFWFAPKQISDLRSLSFLINSHNQGCKPLLKIALSRLIITKSKGASLAADISHSRPHKVRSTNDFEVYKEFEIICKRLSKIINSDKLIGTTKIQKGDARKLQRVKSESIDSIITSPPYLNALDYMRGHKMSLVWLGYKVDDLTSIRSNSVGAEKAPDLQADFFQAKYLTRNLSDLKQLPPKKINMIYRYALDMDKILKETARVLKKKSKATYVIGNSSLQGVFIQNTSIAEEAAYQYNLKLVNTEEREIPHNKRYLPPPSNSNISQLNSRMRTETVMTFKK